jgi:hypothetical protein
MSGTALHTKNPDVPHFTVRPSVCRAFVALATRDDA